MNTNMNGATPGQVTSRQNDAEIATISGMDVEITNDQFILAVFHDDLNEQENVWPLVCSISGNPEGEKYWAQAWPCDTSDATKNWYAQPSLFAQNASGEYRAQRNLARKVYCVMLDDLGTKVPIERLNACPPTWLIETSPMNHQAGYIFEVPIDGEKADALKVSLIEAGLCDKGASGGMTRWMRLPAAINGKPKHGSPPFRCKLKIWRPERYFTVEEIVERLKLSPPEVLASSLIESESDVYSPKAHENAVITALKTKRLYKQSLGNGVHDVTCPWVSEHTDHVDHGSAYFEPSGRSYRGGFRCQHSHGDKYRISQLLDFLGVTTRAAINKSIITVEPGQIDRIVDSAERELAASKRCFQYAGYIATVRDASNSEDAGVKQMSQAALLRELSRCSVWMRFDSQTGRKVVIDPPTKHVGILWDSEIYAHLPKLNGIARQPYLRRDGTLATAAGFDPTTGMFGAFSPAPFNVPDKPTKQQANDALLELCELISEFDFRHADDRAGALAGIVTAVIRGSLPLAPMFHVSAPVMASGKTYLCSLIASFASGIEASALMFPRNNEECRKLLMSELLTSPPVIMFDNLSSDLAPFDSFCTALTGPYITDRVLSMTKTAKVGTRTLFLSSGNNVHPTIDVARRCVSIHLDPKVETPATRKFIKKPLSVVRADRPHYISLVLTIVRGWIVAGGPLTPVDPLASYDEWCSWVRQPLLWLGISDPVNCILKQLDDDHDKDLLGRFLRTWHAAFLDSPTMIRQVIEKANANGNEDLKEILCEVAEERGEINRRRLGKWIARHKERVVGGMCFEKATGKTSSERWLIKSVTSVTEVSFGDGDEDLAAN